MTTSNEAGTPATAVLDKILQEGDPRMTASLGVVRAVRDGVVAGNLKLEDIVVVLAGALTNVERRLLELEDRLDNKS